MTCVCAEAQCKQVYQNSCSHKNRSVLQSTQRHWSVSPAVTYVGRGYELEHFVNYLLGIGILKWIGGFNTLALNHVNHYFLLKNSRYTTSHRGTTCRAASL